MALDVITALAGASALPLGAGWRWLFGLMGLASGLWDRHGTGRWDTAPVGQVGRLRVRERKCSRAAVAAPRKKERVSQSDVVRIQQ